MSGSGGQGAGLLPESLDQLPQLCVQEAKLRTVQGGRCLAQLGPQTEQRVDLLAVMAHQLVGQPGHGVGLAQRLDLGGQAPGHRMRARPWPARCVPR